MQVVALAGLEVDPESASIAPDEATDGLVEEDIIEMVSVAKEQSEIVAS